MSVIVKQYIPFDSKIMKFRDLEEYKNILKAYPSYFNDLPQICQGNAYSIFKDGEIIAITGWVSSIQNFCQIWFFSSEKLDKYFDKEVLATFKTILNLAKSEWERIETTCKENKRNKRFLEFLGFKKECLMKKYGFDGEDMNLYSLVGEQKNAA